MRFSPFRSTIIVCMGFALFWALGPSLGGKNSNASLSKEKKMKNRDAELAMDPRYGHAVFAGGCFWCVESAFEHFPGVVAVISGYSGGPEKNPTYEQVGSGRTGHTEAIDVIYDPQFVSYSDLVEMYWRQVDPTDLGGQFVDRGPQYRPEIFVVNAEQRRIAEASKAALAASGRFEKPILVPITDFSDFYPAEDYHQDFYKKDPLRYKSYRMGSGRDRFIEKMWGSDKTPPRNAPQADNDGISGRTYKRPDETELRKELTPEQFKVTRQNGTERPFQNAFYDHHEAGLYVDIVSGEPLFSSSDKFESGTGWPSFTRPIKSEHIVEVRDRSHGMERVEVRSKIGDSHLGHVFDDGPKPTGLRYCINSAALRFIPKEKLIAEGYGEFLNQISKE